MLRVAVLCNHRMAHGAIKILKDAGMLVGVAVGEDTYIDNEISRQFCSENNIDFLKCSKSNFESELSSWLTQLRVDVAYAMVFPYILPGHLIGIPSLGIINFHTGLLPEFRGANPIFWQMLKGEKEVGISAHAMDASIDTGPILLHSKVSLEFGETYASHIDKLQIAMCDAATAVTMRIIEVSRAGLPLTFTPQVKEKSAYYPRPHMDHVRVHWPEHDAKAICNMASAANGIFDGAEARFRDERLFFVETEVSDRGSQVSKGEAPGTILDFSSMNALVLCCVGEDLLVVNVVRYRGAIYGAGRFLSFFRVQVGEQFS